MADVFISYAREDKAFVRRLHSALASKNLDAWVDWEDIPATADFMQEIFAAIEAADTVVLILSPDWAASVVCRREVEHALSHNKRLVPLVWRDVEPEHLAPGVAALNWIFFRETDDFDTAVESLLSAINTDLERTRALTRLLVRAIEWNAMSRDVSFLLRGVDLAHAEQILTTTPADQQPQPTPLQREYALASRLDAVTRQRRTLALVTTGLVVSVVLAVVAFWQYRVAEERRQAEQTARLDAERKTRIADAQRLAAQADGALDRFPQRSLLLAVEAIETTRRQKEPVVADAEQSLRRALGAVGGRGFGGAGLPVNRFAVSSDGRMAIASDNAAYLWNLTDPSSLVTLPDAKGTISDITFGRDNRWVIAVSREVGPLVWDISGDKPLARPVQLPSGVDRVAAVISGDRRRLIGGTQSGVTVLWDLTSANPAANPRTFASDTFPEFGFFTLGGAVVATSNDGRWMAVKQLGAAAHVWDLHASDSHARAIELTGSDDLLPSVAFSNDSRLFVAAGQDFAVRVWDLTAPDPNARPRVLRGHEGAITRVAFTPDGRWLVTGSMDKTARVWDLDAVDANASVRALRGHGDMVSVAWITSDGRWVVTSSVVNRLDPSGPHDATAYLWDMRRPNVEANPIELSGHEGGVTDALLTADGRRVMTASDGGRLRLWDLTTATPPVSPLVLRGSELGIGDLFSSDDGRWIVAHGVDMSARVWDLRAPQASAAPLLLRPPPGHALHFSPDSRWLVARGGDAGQLANVTAANPAATQATLSDLSTYNGQAPVTFSPDSRWFATGGEYSAARLFDLTAANVDTSARTLDDGGGAIHALTISPDGRWLITNREYRPAEMRVWNLARPAASFEPLRLNGHTKRIYPAVVSADSKWLATGSEDMTVRLWNLARPDPQIEPIVLSGFTKRISACAFSPDGRHFVAAGDDGMVRMWDLEAGRTTKSMLLPGHTAYVFGLHFSLDGRWLTTAGGYGPVRLWNLASSSPASTGRVFPAQQGDVRTVEFSRDNRWMVSVDGNNAARIWDLTSADPTAKFYVLGGHEHGVGFLAISPDSRWVATAGANYATAFTDKVVRLWTLTRGDPSASPFILLGHESGVTALTMSGDSRWLMTGSRDGTVRLWDLKSPNPSAAPIVMSGHGGGVRTIAVSPDSRRVATADAAGTVRLWNLQVDDLITLARTTAGRNLSQDEWELFFQGQPYRKTFAALPAPQPAKSR